MSTATISPAPAAAAVAQAVEVGVLLDEDVLAHPAVGVGRLGRAPEPVHRAVRTRQRAGREIVGVPVLAVVVPRDDGDGVALGDRRSGVVARDVLADDLDGPRFGHHDGAGRVSHAHRYRAGDLGVPPCTRRRRRPEKSPARRSDAG